MACLQRLIALFTVTWSIIVAFIAHENSFKAKSSAIQAQKPSGSCLELKRRNCREHV